MSETSVCEERHVFDVPAKDFKCPKCGAECGDFYVGDSPNHECERLHAADCLVCVKCEYDISGAAFAKQYVTEKRLVPCDECKGSGMVKR